MTFSFDGVITGGDWRIVLGTIRVKSLLAAEQRAQCGVWEELFACN
jgi:hypothetical protein